MDLLNVLFSSFSLVQWEQREHILTSNSYSFVPWWNNIWNLTPPQYVYLYICVCVLSCRLWFSWGPCCHGVVATPPLLVQVVAVAAGGPIVALAKLPDASTRLHHHLLRHGHHNAKEVGILKCLKRSRTRTLRRIKEMMRNSHFGLKLPSCTKNMHRQWIHKNVLLRQADRRRTARSQAARWNPHRSENLESVPYRSQPAHGKHGNMDTSSCERNSFIRCCLHLRTRLRWNPQNWVLQSHNTTRSLL